MVEMEVLLTSGGDSLVIGFSVLSSFVVLLFCVTVLNLL
jgi:hypothetical protein